MIYLFVDTNFFLECQEAKSIPWRKQFGNDDVTIVVIRSVLKELDDKKQNAKSRAKQDRARAAIKLIEQACEDPDGLPITETVRLRYLSKEPSIADFTEHDLDVNSTDHRLVLSALLFKEPGKIIVCAYDATPRVEARTRQLETLHPEEWKVKDQEDERDKQIKKLEAQVNQRAKLDLTFQQRTRILDFNLSQPHIAGPDVVRSALQYAQKNHPYLDPALVPFAHLMEGQFEHYNRKVLEYHAEYEKWLPRWLYFKECEARAVCLMLCLSNTGNGPATRIKATIDARAAGAMLVQDFTAPIEPIPPKQPALPSALGGPSRDEVADLWMQQIEEERRATPVYSGPKFKIVGTTATIEIDRLQHGEQQELRPLFLQFHDYRQAKGFTIDCRIKADEVPEIVTSLNVRVTKVLSEPPWLADDSPIAMT